MKSERIRVLKEEIASTTNPNKLGQLYALMHKEEAVPRRTESVGR